MGTKARFLWVGILVLAACGGGGPEAVQGQQGGGNPPPPPPPQPLTGPPGARSFKSGPIQITADGAHVWVANPDNDSVSRIDTATDAVTEFVLPDPATADSPRTLSVKEDGSEVWVACHDSDRIYVLRGSDGFVLARIDLPWGSGPMGIALSRDQNDALVTLHRSRAAAAIDVATRQVRKILEPIWHTPRGVTWIEGERAAWISHLIADGEHTRLTRIDLSGAEPAVDAEVTVFATDPRHSSTLAAPDNHAEGGYLTPRGHTAQRPGTRQLWLTVQYNNITEDRYSPDSTIQTTLRRLMLDTLALPNGNDEKIIVSGRETHETRDGGALVSPGWNAGVSGPIDLAFSANGDLCYLVCEQSDDVVIVPTDTTNVRPAGAPPLPEVSVGSRPMGIAVSPVEGAAYVMNRFSRDVSVIDLGGERELRRIPVTPVTGEPHSAEFLRGAVLFHTSNDPRISSNGKVSCASCHVNAETDGRDWAFHRLPGRSGPRPTLTMRGLGLHFGPRDPLSGFGQLHRSGDRDEVQDFEHTFQSDLMGGTGFVGAGAPDALGAPMAGRDADLDAIATYLLELPPLMRSPYRAADGSLSERATRGAALFLAASCDACHIPETGFVDFKFHDVGSRRPNNEEELNQGSRGAYVWKVNTKTLVGLWATPGYDGVATFAPTIGRFLEDISGRTSHGDIRNLTSQQRADLAEFVLSIDGNTTPAEVRNARDTSPPSVTRAEPRSLTTIDVWFSEPVDEASAEDLANWQVLGPGGPVAVTDAQWNAQNGDRVTLTTQLAKSTSYTVVPGAILDTAPAPNALDGADPANRPVLDIGAELTVTLGGSGYENLSIEVHDAAAAGAGLSTWSHDGVWLFLSGSIPNPGFVRFDWKDAFVNETGAASASDIVAASFSLDAEKGHRHPVEARRCLLAWSDHHGGNWNKNADGAPTWRDHDHPNGRWNTAAARRRTAGVEGDAAVQYDGGNDTANTPDTVAPVGAINERVTFQGARVSEAFRFWFDNPGVDYGYVLTLAPGALSAGLIFHNGESLSGRNGPVLTITYKLP